MASDDGHKSADNSAGKSLDAVLRMLPDYDSPWWRKTYLVPLNIMLFCTMLYSSAGGYDNSLMNGLQSLDKWQEFMGHPTGAWLGFVNAVQAVGGMCGYPIMAYMANIWGRKKCIYVGIAIISLGAGLQTGAHSPGMFIAARAVVGLAAGFFGAAPVLITETAFPTHRGRVTAAYNTFYYVGSLIAAWATFGTRSYTTSWAWRVPSILQILIPIAALPGLFFCPESPRWLISQGRSEEARAVFIKYHAGSDANSPLVAFEMADVEEALRIEASHHKSTSYGEMFKTKGNRHRLIISVTLGVFAQWNGVGVVSYYLSEVLSTVGITSVTDQTLINGGLQLWNLIIAVVAASLVDRLGRRPIFLTSGVGMLVCYVVITGLSGSFASTKSSSTGIAVIPMLYLFYAFYNVAYSPLLAAYPAEIWSYQLRSRGIAVTYCATFLGLFINLFVNPIALAAIAWKYYIVYIVILIGICLTTFFLYPETKGRTLEEMAVVFDGFDADIPAQGVMLRAMNDKFGEDLPQNTHMEHFEDDKLV